MSAHPRSSGLIQIVRACVLLYVTNLNIEWSNINIFNQFQWCSILEAVIFVRNSILRTRVRFFEFRMVGVRVLCQRFIFEYASSKTILKDSSDASHFFNVGQRRIRHRTTMNLNDVFFNRFWVDLEIHRSNSESFYVGSAAFRHWFQK